MWPSTIRAKVATKGSPSATSRFYRGKERITTPIRLVSVYRWSGENLALIFTPMAAVIFLGLFLIGKRLRDLDAS